VRQVEIESGLRLRFPRRSEEFDQGVEIGVLAVLMATGGMDFERSISVENLDQARALADKLGYHLVCRSMDAHSADVLFKTGRPRPQLTLVHTAPGAAVVWAPGGPARRSTPTLVRRIEEALVS
jgi:hypothetical protein